MSNEINKSPIKDLVRELNDDDRYRYGWQANIAMAFVDEVRWHQESAGRKYLSLADIHKIANKAANNFLKLLCAEDKNEQNDD